MQKNLNFKQNRSRESWCLLLEKNLDLLSNKVLEAKDLNELKEIKADIAWLKQFFEKLESIELGRENAVI